MARNMSGITDYVAVYTSGKTLYTFFVDITRNHGYVYDFSTGAFALSPTYANTASYHAESGSNGVYLCKRPILTAGQYIAVTCEMAGASPANTDTQIFTETISIGL